MKLFHLSDDPAIIRFEPRPSDYTSMPVVWAIEDARLHNYLLPRDCPRVCICAGEGTTAVDRARWLGDAKAVIAVEAAWMERVRAAQLYRYAMPVEGFMLQDAGAGYWVSRVGVTPDGVALLDDLPGELAARSVELRVLPSLWELHDAVAASSLVFSMIRMRNAGTR